MSTGGCLCGGVRYRLTQTPTAVWLCHCRQCRRAQGSAFAASVPVPRTGFSLVAGENLLRAYRASPAKRRWFCSHCGSPVYSEVDDGAMLRLRAGTLDDESTLSVAGHIFDADRAPWDHLADDAPRHPAREPERQP